MLAVCSFILQAGAKFELGGIWERGWSVEVIDQENYQDIQKAELAEIARLQREIEKIKLKAIAREERDYALFDKICERLP